MCSASIIGCHLSISVCCRARNASGLCCSTEGMSWPRLPRRVRTAGSARAVLIAALIFAMIGSGVPFGTQSPCHTEAWKSGKAASSVVGTSGAAASPKALTRISREIRSWALHHRGDKSLTELAQMYNPCIRGWITYYSHFYKTQLRPTLKRIDAYVIRWARRKFKRMRHQTKGARDWFDLRRAYPILFAHWVLCHGNGRTSGAV
jgi:hypothetical protein